MPEVAILDAGTMYEQEQLDRAPFRHSADLVDLYRLHEIDLTHYAGLIVSGSADQEYLFRERRIIRSFLDSGRVLVFSGHLFRDWLPGGGPFVPKGVDRTRRIPKGVHTSEAYDVRVLTAHPIFDGVRPEDLTFRRGVRGFFARGHHPPPEGAEIVLTLAGGEPVLYIDRTSTRGTILVNAGADLVTYIDADSTAGRVGRQLVDWVIEEFVWLQATRSPV